MAQWFDYLNDKHVEMISAQPLFFTASAAAEGLINLSPKGLDSFRILSPGRVAWLDLAGSGNETHAHLSANGRITIMFCNFQQPALILRIYGRGRPVLPQDEDFGELAAHFTLLPGTRQIFDITVEKVLTSCGWGVPVMSLDHQRDTLTKYHANLSPEEWLAEEHERPVSNDGLPLRLSDRYIEGEQKV